MPFVYTTAWCRSLNLPTFILVDLSFNLACCLSSLSTALKVNTELSIFSYSPPSLLLLLLQSSSHLPECVALLHAPIAAGFRCKSYLNRSPAVTLAAMGNRRK